MTLDERLLAYVDGELTGEDLVKFEAEMAADPRLRDEVDKHRGLNARLAAARAERADLARNAAKGAKGPRTIAQAAPVRVQLSGWHWAAILAGLSVGVAAGLWAGRYGLPPTGPVVAEGGVLTTAGELDSALTNQLVGQKGPITIGGTFRTAKGRYCRTFLSTPDRLAGLACRQSDGWVLQTSTVLGLPNIMPRAVLAAVDGLIVGAPLDQAAERAARARDWTP
ncbi:MAG: anti-sigma factor family protein [Phenylobacterium sp.]